MKASRFRTFPVFAERNWLTSRSSSQVVTGIASLSRAGDGEVTFANSAKSIPNLKKSRATAVFVTQRLAPMCLQTSRR